MYRIVSFYRLSIVHVSFTSRSRIVHVSFTNRSRIVHVSFSYHRSAGSRDMPSWGLLTGGRRGAARAQTHHVWQRPAELRNPATERQLPRLQRRGASARTGRKLLGQRWSSKSGRRRTTYTGASATRCACGSRRSHGTATTRESKCAVSRRKGTTPQATLITGGPASPSTAATPIDNSGLLKTTTCVS